MRTITGTTVLCGLLAVCVAPVAHGEPTAATTQPAQEEPAAANAVRDVDEASTDPSEASAELETIPLPQRVDPPPLPAVGEDKRLDEIVVTAQKTSKLQLIKDVPISISVVDEKFIANWGITDVREAMLFVPNVRVESAGFFSSPRVRGFSVNNNNKAFEPPAGFALDGIPYARAEYFNAAVFDIERIEALRGPQGTTFGKNTTAGLIHVITKNPSADWEGAIDLQAGDLDRRRVEAVVSGPVISDFMNFRIAALYDERDGFIRNTTAEVSPVADSKLRGQGRRGVRAKLAFPELLGTSTIISAETVKLDSRGVGAELFHASERVQSVLRRYDPDADFELNNYVASIDAADGREVMIKTFNAESRLELGPWQLVALGGFSEMKNKLDVDADFTPAPALFLADRDRSPTATVEFRAEPGEMAGLFGLQDLFGADLGHTTLLTGVFYQHREIRDGGFRFTLEPVPYLELSAAAGEDDPPNAVLEMLPPEVLDALFSAVPANPPGGGGLSEQSYQGFDQWSDAYAVFGQAEWSFYPRWTFQLGLRLSKEDKNAKWNSIYTSASPPVLLRAAGIEEFTAKRDISEEQLQPKLSLNYRATEDLSLFAHWARAYKGGGFNAFAYSGVDDQLVYDPEIANDYGIDVKGSLFDGSAQYNISFYRLDIDDFQVLTNEPDPLVLGLGVTKVENAPKARAQGVEADITWRLTTWLTVLGTLAVNDTEYLDFKFNACPADRDGAMGAGSTDADPSDPRCDATGKPFPYTPKYNATLFSMINWPITGNAIFSVGGGFEYMSSQFLDTDLDERKTQDAFFRYRANIGISNPKSGWSFKIVGENLTDERSSLRNNDLLAGLFINIQEQPRQIYGQFRYTFF